MKTIRCFSLGLLCTAALALPASLVAQSDAELLEAARSTLRTDRRAAVEGAMQFTEAEAKAFWPLYDAYRAEMDKAGTKIKDLIISYSQAYPDITTDNAKNGLKQILDLEKQIATIRAKHFVKIGKALPPVKALRFAQVDMRLDITNRLAIASQIPLVPIEGKIALKSSTDTYGSGATPGMVSVTTIELEAVVLSIDRADRSVTLLGKDGIKETITVSDDVTNFDQVKVGDKVLMVLSDSLVVQLGDSVPGARPDEVVKLAPVGAKPGGVIANTVEIRATIIAIDVAKRTVTLRGEDGMEKASPVRSDVDLAKVKVGDKVLVRKTEAVALRITPGS
ncbi:MAG: hypothetical protein IAE82_15825 [Opitutaceae bacterium]|nr:hypothetical protein [Opitutaceae bacterium]